MVYLNESDDSYYFGYASASFTINAASIAKATIASIVDQTYTGSAIKPSVTVTLDEVTLEEDTDYTVAYENNTNVGTATVTVTGTGNYTGSVTDSFEIVEAESDNEEEDDNNNNSSQSTEAATVDITTKATKLLKKAGLKKATYK